MNLFFLTFAGVKKNDFKSLFFQAARAHKRVKAQVALAQIPSSIYEVSYSVVFRNIEKALLELMSNEV
jgi:hypothetical protein